MALICLDVDFDGSLQLNFELIFSAILIENDFKDHSIELEPKKKTTKKKEYNSVKLGRKTATTASKGSL